MLCLYCTFSEGGFLDIRTDERLARPFTPSLPSSRAMTYVDEEPVEAEHAVNGSTTTSTFEMPSLTDLQPPQVGPVF